MILYALARCARASYMCARVYHTVANHKNLKHHEFWNLWVYFYYFAIADYFYRKKPPARDLCYHTIQRNQFRVPNGLYKITFMQRALFTYFTFENLFFRRGVGIYLPKLFIILWFLIFFGNCTIHISERMYTQSLN